MEEVLFQVFTKARATFITVVDPVEWKKSRDELFGQVESGIVQGFNVLVIQTVPSENGGSETSSKLLPANIVPKKEASDHYMKECTSFAMSDVVWESLVFDSNQIVGKYVVIHFDAIDSEDNRSVDVIEIDH